MSPSISYHCLYTKHKTQKRKVWIDGKITVNSTGIVTLFPVATSDSIIGTSCTSSSNTSVNNGGNAGIDSVAISMNDVQYIHNKSITNLEMEKFLVQIEDQYKENNIRSSNQNNNNNNINESLKSNGKIMSIGMQKLMKNKFKVPQKVYQYPSTVHQNDRGLKRRPLQPGEWMRQCQMKMMSNNSGGNEQISQCTNHSIQNQQHNQIDNNRNSINAHYQPNNNQNQYNNPMNTFSRNGNVNTENSYIQRHAHDIQSNISNNNNNNNNNNSVRNHQHDTSITNLNQNHRGVSFSSSSKHKSTSNGGFTSNEFNPSSFYGNEEDDDSDSDNNIDGFDEQSHHHSSNNEAKTDQSLSEINPKYFHRNNQDDASNNRYNNDPMIHHQHQQQHQQQQHQQQQHHADHGSTHKNTHNNQDNMSSSHLLELFSLPPTTTATTTKNNEIDNDNTSSPRPFTLEQDDDDGQTKEKNNFLDKLLQSEAELDDNQNGHNNIMEHASNQVVFREYNEANNNIFDWNCNENDINVSDDDEFDDEDDNVVTNETTNKRDDDDQEEEINSDKIQMNNLVQPVVVKETIQDPKDDEHIILENQVTFDLNVPSDSSSSDDSIDD